MNPKPDENELIELERRYWQSMKNGDAQAVARLSAERCLVAGASGVAELDRAALVKMMTTATWRLRSFSLSSPVVRFLGEEVAMVAYKIHEELTVEGANLSLDAADTSTWIKAQGEWLCAAHTEALAGDPFARDRSPLAGSAMGSALASPTRPGEERR